MIVGCIFILVAMMSFFSLASIINGFETSPFVDEQITYPKQYTTSQEVSFDVWRNSVIRDDNLKIMPVKIKKSGMIDSETFPSNKYLFLDYSLIKTGIIIEKPAGKFGQHEFVKINKIEIQQLNGVSSYYDNGLINMMAKNGPA
jgi:hypothetical protein